MESLQNAIAEMRVLSMCDEIVGSYGSSFSAVAASWGAITKYDIRADGSYWNTAWNEPCWRFASRGHNAAISDAASFLITKDVTKVCPRLKIGKNQTGIKVKDFRRGTCE